MKLRPSSSFWINVFLCLLNITVFVYNQQVIHFYISMVCCFMALMLYKVDKLIFNREQEQLNKSVAKSKEEDKHADF